MFTKFFYWLLRCLFGFIRWASLGWFILPDFVPTQIDDAGALVVWRLLGGEFSAWIESHKINLDEHGWVARSAFFMLRCSCLLWLCFPDPAPTEVDDAIMLALWRLLGGEFKWIEYIRYRRRLPPRQQIDQRLLD
jgi:hypothetical protein